MSHGSLWADGADEHTVSTAVAPRRPAVPGPAETAPDHERPGRPRRLVLAGAAGAAVSLVALGVLAGGALDRGDPAALGAGPALVDPGSGGGESIVGRVHDAAGPGVVSIRAGSAGGTGFLIDRNGTVVTNAHVVAGGGEVRVRFGDRGDAVSAEVLGSDPSSDLAALRVDPDEVPGGTRPLPLADSDRVEVGDRVVAIGHPLGLDQTTTAGVVSGLGRQIQAPNGFQIDRVIQTDAPVNPGNSGGPLLDDRGRVVGVNSQIATAGARGNIGIAFAVPSNAVREVIPRLARGQEIRRPYLGLTTGTPAGGGDVTVQEVVPGGPAADAGLRAGDRVVRADGDEVDDPEDVTGAIADRSPGDRVTLEVERGGDRRRIEVELGTRPARTP